MITKIKKRDGSTVKFSKNRIRDAIEKAINAVEGKDGKEADRLAEKVTQTLNKKFKGSTPTVEEIQDVVEKTLIVDSTPEIAKAYIIYRQERKQIREAKSLLGVDDDVKLSMNAIKVLERRYLIKDECGKDTETPKQLFQRVARNIAQADTLYDKNADLKRNEKEFYNLMANMEF
ncbi:MAG: ATP cone domain-containing protein, partial [Candidatus Altiarchaeota archaeon]|nr:ATP cone domain-containing protein [Candidatus Altiarchaeota archaeon]